MNCLVAIENGIWAQRTERAAKRAPRVLTGSPALIAPMPAGVVAVQTGRARMGMRRGGAIELSFQIDCERV